MKKGILLLFFLIECISGYGNAIDSIKSNGELIKFLAAIDSNLVTNRLFYDDADSIKDKAEHDLVKEYYKNDINRKIEKYGSNTFYKTDIDGNGLTDLLIEGYNTVVVLDMGNRYDVHQIDAFSEHKYLLKKVIHSENTQTLLLFVNLFNSDEKAPVFDTLIYKFGGLVEYHNSCVSDSRIERITFTSHECVWGDCQYNIELKQDGNAIFNDQGYMEFGTLFGKVSGDDVNELLNLLGYIGVKKLRDSYDVNWSDDHMVSLRINYINGDAKTIYDYGERGTVGLQRVYEIFRKIKRETEWQKWNTAPADIDFFILAFQTSFKNGLRYGKDEFGNKAYGSIDSGKKFGRYRCLRETELFNSPNRSKQYSCLTLNRDSTFVLQFTDSNKYGNRDIYRYSKRKLALGNWQQKNDSTFIFNWDAALTLNTIRNKEMLRKYFDDKGVVSPMRIENWTFIYSPEEKNLHPPGYVRRSYNNRPGH